ncbi:hypothetical protein PFTANZ_06104, partial [Plasmodium falciparum Tanzania (2000708)]
MTGKRKVSTENKLSARGVLEEIGLEIYKEIEKTIPHKDQLIGTLSKAEFADRLYKESNGGLRSAYSDACSLTYKFHTNNTIYSWDERNPCYGRKQDRFSEDQESECGNKIRDYKSENVGTSCAPPRRRHMCDQNLEFLDNNHTDTIHDVLGNVLVTAKYEGESIVNNHPDKNSNGNKSGICTSLARSFADIGDIVRGKDMFKPNVHDKVEKGLQVVFGKIYNSLPSPAKSHYKDDNGSGNYLKLREAWWTANRDQVWKAITCKAPEKANYFKPPKNSTQYFSNEYCGGKQEGYVPTNLDYVPQFLRWFGEWAEEFCRKKKDKLKKVKEACRGKTGGMYCSHNGCDCEKTIGKIRKFCRASKCTKCNNECLGYENWIKDQKMEFEKQREKYESEINRYNSSKEINNKFNDKYYKEFYEKLKVEQYESVNKFLELLNEEKECKNIGHQEKIDFNKSDYKNTFSRSEYCQVCPDCGVECTNGTCKPKDKDNDCETNDVYEPPRGVKPTDINVLYSGDEHGDITQKLKDFCTDPSKDMGKNDENWQCYYKNGDDNKCQMTSLTQTDEKHRYVMTFHAFFDFWVRNLLMDTISWETDLRNCLNNTAHRYIMNFDNFIQFWVTSLLMDTTDWDRKLKTCINNNNNDGKCITECYENCTCFDKWVKKKEKEWKNVKEHIAKEKENERKKYCDTLKDIFSVYNAQVIEKIYKGNQKWKERIEKVENVECSKVKIGTNASQDQIDIFLSNLKEDANQCTTKNPKSACDNPETARIITPATPPNPSDASIEKSGKTESVEEVCKDVKRYIRENNTQTKTQINTGCNKKGNSKKWECEKNIDPKHAGACMPPRRQTLCIYYLSHDKEKDNIKTAEKLKDGVMKSAALETYFLWKYYTEQNSSAQNELNNGTIPKNFIRWMEYTFSDYRDLFFGTDISNHRYIIAVKNNVNMALTQNVSEKKFNLNNIKNEWWQKHGPEIWMGMLCALTNGIDKKKEEKIKILEESQYKVPPEEFAQRPQFLRWLTEWGEDFCKKRGEKVKKLLDDCKECNITNNASGGVTKTCEKDSPACKECTKACGEYKKWLATWKEHYDKQKRRYIQVKERSQYNVDFDVKQSLQAYEYLNKKLEKICQSDSTNGDCEYKCMEHKSKQSPNNTDMPASLDNEPEEVEGRCNCTPPPKACDIVKSLFTSNNNFDDACSLKYSHGKEKHTQWKCINDKTSSPSDKETLTTSPSPTSTCIPPRRQKLYVGKLHTLSDLTPLGLRKAFIEAAAVETFFAWHKFIKEKEKEIKEKKKQENGGFYILRIKEEDILSDQDHPQNKLKKGDIPEEFKRQMFYTFGDYKDIFFGKDAGNGKDLGKDSDTTSISDKIVSILKADSQPPSGKPQDKREEWWQQHGPAIWDGMVCSLSYDTEKQKKVQDVHNNLIAPPNNNKYNDVKLVSKSGKLHTSLSDFATVPQFLRWFEEWVEEFCRKKKIKIDKIEDECRGEYDNGGKKYCSGDGYDCIGKDLKHNDMFTDLNCRHCGEECRNYKKWIEEKVEEFYKQKKKYEKGFENTRTNLDNKYVKEFYETSAGKYKSVDLFLDTLKERSHCSMGMVNRKIDFKNPLETFSPSIYCKTCPLYGVNCNSRKCVDITENEFKKKNVLDEIIINDKSHTSIDIEMIDRRGQYMQENLDNPLFKESYLLKSVRDQKWDCNFIHNKIDLCEINKFNENIDTDESITFKVLIERWLQDFLEGYYISKKQIDLFTKKEENKCECVKKWAEKKEGEWEKINEHFNKQKHDDAFDMDFKVKNYFEKNASDLKDWIDNFKRLNNIDDYQVCNVHNNCKSADKKNKIDMVSILLSELKKEIETCKNQGNEKTKIKCDASPTNDELDEEYELGTTDTSPSAAPDICKDVIQSKSEETICGDDKRVDCNKVGKDDPIKVPMDPKSDEDHLNEMGDKHNCSGIIIKTNGEWKNTKQLNYPNPCESIYASPRRQKFCVHELDKAKNQKELRTKLLTVAANQGYNLAIKHHEYKDKYTVNPCNALKYSFYDYQHIILGDDPMEPEKWDTESALKRIFGNRNTEDAKPLSRKRKDFWKENKECVWSAMKCGYNQGKTIGEQKAQGKGTKNDVNNIPDINGCTNNTPTEFDNVPQFLMWFTEWSEDFCNHKKTHLKKLEQGCRGCTLRIDGTCEKDGSGCQKCSQACEEYKAWLQNWKDQYKKQSKKYSGDKKKELYKTVPKVKNSTHAYEYLQTQLEKLCEKGKCDYTCMKNPSTENSTKNMPESLDEKPKEVKDKCNCVPDECSGLSVTGSGFADGASFGGGILQGKCITMKGGLANTTPSSPTNCVQKIAYNLWKKGKNKTEYIEHIFKGNGMDLRGKCKKLSINEGSEKPCALNTRYPNYNNVLDDKCKDKGMNRLKTGEEWRCQYIKELKTNICIPPRREDMCLVEFKNIFSSDVNDSKKLLEIVQKIAKHEGDDIIRKLLEEEPCKEYLICDAMKYSFADLGDVIRGRDLWNRGKNHNRIESKLRLIFDNIYNNMEPQEKYKYKDRVNYYELRSDWWDTNRKEIWKAMTCNAPDVANLYKKGPRTTNILQGYCDHDNDPPYDDYIPQILRWMTEWSECYCKTLQKKIQEMKNECDTCKDDEDINKCRKCKDYCKEYSILVSKWEEQYNKYKEKYKDLYSNIDKTKLFAINENYAKTFFKNMDNIGTNKENNKCKAATADKYLHMTSQCETHAFIKNGKNNYAFNKWPNEYEEECTYQITNNPLDKCPDDSNKEVCNNFQCINTCISKIFNNKLDNWTSYNVDDLEGKNAGVLVPPRRRHLCLHNTIIKLRSMINKEDFEKEFLNSVYTEGKLLWDKYNKNSKDVMEAMRYSFADYGDIIKGTDMLDTTTSKNINKRLTELLKQSNNSPKNVDSWWNKNKKQVWYAMLCGYKKGNPSSVITSEECTIPNIHKDHQFLRWLVEWGKQACKEHNIKKINVETKCNCKNMGEKHFTDVLSSPSCKTEIEEYIKWNNNTKLYYDGLNDKYQRYINSLSTIRITAKPTQPNAQEYIKAKNPECNIDFSKRYEIYNNNIQEEILEFKEILKKICPNLKFDDDVIPDQVTEKKEKIPSPSQYVSTSDILTSTIPLGIALALGSIAFLFIK